MSQASFVAVDWGMTSFRLWVMDEDAGILATTTGPYGMSRLKPDEYDRVLENALKELGFAGDLPVIISGMAGNVSIFQLCAASSVLGWRVA